MTLDVNQPNESQNYLGIPCGVILEELKMKKQQLMLDPTNADLEGSVRGLYQQLAEVGHYVPDLR